jgi:predicted amidohydrolase YtcJ
MKFMKSLLVAILIIMPFTENSLLINSVEAAADKADLILLNGRIWTGNKKQIWAEAIAAKGERIIFVGANTDAKKLADTKTRVIDLQGKLALPGFIDDHTHFIEGGFHLLSVDLRDAATPAEFAERIRNRATKLSKGRWIRGGDWDHERWGGELPNREWIDKFTADNPVFVTRLDGHMGLANSAALKFAGITKDTPSPSGGTIVKDAVTGEPTGVLKDDAMSLMYKVIPDESDAEYEEALQASLNYAASVGVTSVQDITGWRDYEIYKRFKNSNRLTVRVYARTPMSQWQRQAELVKQQGAGDHWLKLGGLKAFMDGSLGSTTALFFEPFTDAPDNHGLMLEANTPEGKLKETMKQADKAGLQCSIHAIGDKANHLLLNYFEAIEKENGKRDRRFRIEHAQHLLPDDIKRFAQLGVIPSMQPYHAADDGRWAEKRIGKERIKTTYAFRSLLDAGAVLTFGSDWFVAPLSPVAGIHAAVTRQTIDGKNPNGWVPEQKISVEEAIRAYTSSCAYAEFAENDKGTLEVGKLADIVVLSQDLFKINSNEIEKTKLVYTIVGGRIVRGN